MKKDLERLEHVQKVDSEIYSLRLIIEEAPAEIKEIQEGVDAETVALRQAEEALKAAQLDQKNKEGDLKEKEANIKKYEAQLSQVKTNQEYASLQSEIRSLKADNSLLEESILELFDRVDVCRKQVDAEKARMAEIEKAAGEKKKVIEQRVSEAKSKIGQLKQERDQLIKEVDKEIASLYNRIVEKKEGLALVKLGDHDACPACHVQLRAQQINEIQIGENIVLCEQCSRILYTS